MWSHTTVSLYSSSVAKSNTNHYGSVGPMFVADLPPQMSVFVSHSWTLMVCVFLEGTSPPEGIRCGCLQYLE